MTSASPESPRCMIEIITYNLKQLWCSFELLVWFPSPIILERININNTNTWPVGWNYWTRFVVFELLLNRYYIHVFLAFQITFKSKKKKHGGTPHKEKFFPFIIWTTWKLFNGPHVPLPFLASTISLEAGKTKSSTRSWKKITKHWYYFKLNISAK